MAPNLMPPVIEAESIYKQVGAKFTTKTKYLETQKPITGNRMEGARIVALVESSNYNHTIVSDYIRSVLYQYKIHDSYGTLAGIQYNAHMITPTLIFGIPGGNCQKEALPPPPYNLPLLIRDDHILMANGFATRWSLSPIYHTDQVMLESLSLGLEGDLNGGGSFTGFLWQPSAPAEAFGLTAAHCVPGAIPGMAICSPSTLEITSRFNRLVRYTNFAPAQEKLRHNSAKESDADDILHRYRFQPANQGVTFIDHGNTNQTLTGVFVGSHLGSVIATELGDRAGLLKWYDQELVRYGRNIFGAQQFWKTRVDWCIFSCLPNRYGGNIYEEQFVNTVGDLYPGAVVEKVGRSTGVSEGEVNGITVQRWDSSADDVMHEIAIMGKVEVFATTGDSGGCVLVNEDGIYKAAGMLIGRNLAHDFALATPLRLILAAAASYGWA